MGYRVIYGEDPFEKPKPRKGRLGLLTAGCLLAFVVGVRCFWPQGAETLNRIILPEQNTANAFGQMTRDILEGEPLGDAVTTFCRTIVEDAIGAAD